MVSLFLALNPPVPTSSIKRYRCQLHWRSYVSQWWIKLSRMAAVIVASPRKSAHSSNPLLEVMIRDVFLNMLAAKLKKRTISFRIESRRASMGGNQYVDTLNIGGFVVY